jgi:hypothetical protein
MINEVFFDVSCGISSSIRGSMAMETGGNRDNPRHRRFDLIFFPSLAACQVFRPTLQVMKLRV